MLLLTQIEHTSLPADVSVYLQATACSTWVQTRSTSKQGCLVTSALGHSQRSCLLSTLALRFTWPGHG